MTDASKLQSRNSNIADIDAKARSEIKSYQDSLIPELSNKKILKIKPIKNFDKTGVQSMQKLS